MERASLLCACLLVLAMPAAVRAAPERRPMKLADLFRFQRVADPQVSPDGKSVAYVVTSVDLAGNKTSSAIWLAATGGGGAPRQLTNSGKKDNHPRWSPDSKHILFASNRSGSPQLWAIALTGGEARQLTTISTGAATGIWSPDGKSIAFVSAVFPEYSAKPFKESDGLNKKRADQIEKNPVKAKVFTRLFFRHWDSYVEDKRQHLFVMAWAAGKGGEPRDITPGDRDAYPTSDTFSLGDDFTFSPDGKYLLYTAPPERDEAWSTNYDICRVPVAGGEVEVLTRGNDAADVAPRFAPNGKSLVYRAQKRAGFEADRWQLYIVATDESGAFQGKPRSVTEPFDGSPDGFAWSGDGKKIYFSADQKATQPIFSVSVEDGKVERVLPGGMNAALSIGGNGKYLAFTQAALDRPAEVYLVDLSENGAGRPAKKVQLSHANDKLLAKLDMPRPESVTVMGADDVPMQMWILKPLGFDAKKKYPLVYLVHGGPQGAWEDGWSYRWCPELWAAQGYVVALPNPRGSTGFGQKYVDEISGDWGGKCFGDLIRGVDYLEKLPYIDKERMAAAGASFGGYMMNWFAVSTGRFRTLITHCGVWNFESMYATTDELWFDEWEHGGPPWGTQRKSYEKHSPHRKAANLGKFKTPMLIIQNDLDFRCPVSQGHELFSSLQRQGVKSRFINFPDEGHWVLKPKNSEYWHKEVFAWLKKHVPPGGK
jgi:dipeptidyl aminopeptidase/acylaminoacyl peptidase